MWIKQTRRETYRSCGETEERLPGSDPPPRLHYPPCAGTENKCASCAWCTTARKPDCRQPVPGRVSPPARCLWNHWMRSDLWMPAPSRRLNRAPTLLKHGSQTVWMNRNKACLSFGSENRESVHPLWAFLPRFFFVLMERQLRCFQIQARERQRDYPYI